MHYMDACSLFTHIQITSWVESILCMSMQSFGWLSFVGSHTQIKTHNLTHGFEMLVLSWDQGFEGVWHWLINVAWHYIHQVEMKRQRFIKNKVMAWLLVANVDKVEFHTTMWSHLPLRGMMVMMFGGCKVNTIMVLLTRSMPLSSSMQVALANGHCEATFANIKLLFYWHVSTLQ
jgi:hypothetical protein